MHAIVMAAEAQHNPLVPAASDLVWGGVCFLVILFFFWRIALPRMGRLLDERGEAIEGNIAKADEAERKAEEKLEEYTKQLADARSEAGRIRDAARGDGQRIVAEARQQASDDAARITASAEAQIAAERQSAMTSLRTEVGSLALDLAGNVLGETLRDDARAEQVVDRFLAELESDESASSGTQPAGSTS